MKCLSIQNLHVNYGDAEILRDINLDVYSGEIVAIIGPNGSGKSTLLKALSGVLDDFNGRVTKGEVVYYSDQHPLGTSLLSIQTHKLAENRIAYIPDGGRLFPSLSVKRNLELGGYRFTDTKVVKRQVDLVVGQIPLLGGLLNRQAGVLSGGERQLVSVARALMSDPEILFVDEVSAGLSPNHAVRIFELLSGLSKDGKSIVLADQNQVLARKFGSVIYLIDTIEPSANRDR